MLSSGSGEQVLSVKRDRSDLCILIGQFFSDYFIGYRYTKQGCALGKFSGRPSGA